MTLHIVRCYDGGYTVVSDLHGIVATRARRTELRTFIQAYEFAVSQYGEISELDTTDAAIFGDYRSFETFNDWGSK